jgi:hypothetical protein
MFVYDKISKRVEYFEVWLEEHTAWHVAMPGNKVLRERSPAAAMPARLAAQTPRLTNHRANVASSLRCHKTLSVTAIMQP